MVCSAVQCSLGPPHSRRPLPLVLLLGARLELAARGLGSLFKNGVSWILRGYSVDTSFRGYRRRPERPQSSNMSHILQDGYTVRAAEYGKLARLVPTEISFLPQNLVPSPKPPPPQPACHPARPPPQPPPLEEGGAQPTLSLGAAPTHHAHRGFVFTSYSIQRRFRGQEK